MKIGKNRALSIVFCLVAIMFLPGLAQAQWYLFRLGSVVTGGRPHDMVIDGYHAYVGDWDSGLSIIDVSDLRNPRKIGGYNTAGMANSVQVFGNYAYVADWNRGLAIIDITNPYSPQQVSFWDSPGQAVNLYLSGNYAYIADYNAGIAIVDISNPQSPRSVSRVTIGGFATGIWGQGNYIYVANSLAGLKSFDISIPDTAILVATYNSDGDANNITGAGNYIYLSDGLQGVKIFSIADSGRFNYVSIIETPGYVNDVAPADTMVYIADDVTGVIAASVAQPSFPVISAIYESRGTPMGVYAIGNYAFLGDTTCFTTLILTDNEAVNDNADILPSSFEIKQIYPNPFNPRTTVEFSLARRLPLSLDVFDLSGRLIDHIITGLYEPGEHSVVWNASRFASGTYLVRLSSGGYSKSAKITLLK